MAGERPGRARKATPPTRQTRRAAERKAAKESATAVVKPPEEQPLDAVICVVRRDDAGSLSVDIVPNGDVRIGEVDTILVKALKGWREKADLNID